MRKLIVSMNLSLDGCLSDEDHGLDWHFSRWTNDMGEAFGRQLSQADTLLLGRVTFQVMSAAWTAGVCCSNYSRDDLPVADLMYRHTKLVVSKTLPSPLSGNPRILRGGLKAALSKLKSKPGKDIILLGSATLLNSLLKLDLVDEFRLWLHPVLLGSGRPMFGSLQTSAALKLSGVETFESGVVLLSYQRLR